MRCADSSASNNSRECSKLHIPRTIVTNLQYIKAKRIQSPFTYNIDL